MLAGMTGTTRITIRLPSELAAELLHQAEAEHRSLASLAAHRLATDGRTIERLPHWKPKPPGSAADARLSNPEPFARRQVQPILKGNGK